MVFVLEIVLHRVTAACLVDPSISSPTGKEKVIGRNSAIPKGYCQLKIAHRKLSFDIAVLLRFNRKLSSILPWHDHRADVTPHSYLLLDSLLLQV